MPNDNHILNLSINVASITASMTALVKTFDEHRNETKDMLSDLKDSISISSKECDEKIDDVSDRVGSLEIYHHKQQGFMGATKKYGGWLIAIVTTLMNYKP